METKINSETIFAGKVLTVKKDDIRLPDGNKGYREYCEHNGAVAVIPVDKDGTVYMVRQYRYACGRDFLEVPAGKYDYIGEPPIKAAARELKEETGLTAKNMVFIGNYISSPAILTEKIALFMATDLTVGETDFDDDEFINIEKYPLNKLVDMVIGGEIEDGKTIAAVLKANKILSGGV